MVAVLRLRWLRSLPLCPPAIATDGPTATDGATATNGARAVKRSTNFKWWQGRRLRICWCLGGSILCAAPAPQAEALAGGHGLVG